MTKLQEEFAQSAAKLIQKAADLGYGVHLGEALRTPEQAKWNAEHGKGITHSLHLESLAIDLIITIEGVYQEDNTSGCYSALGSWWKSLGPNYRWGGDFIHLKDYDHYSITPDGIRA